MNKSSLYLLGLVGGLGVASSDIYLSCLPDMVTLHCIDPHTLNTTLIIYFLATAFTGLSYSCFLSIISRQKLYVIAALLFVGACFIQILFPYVFYIGIGRIMQGIAFGIMQPLLISTIKENFKENTSNALSSFSLASESLSIMSPLLGSLSFIYISWNSPFIILAAVASLLLLNARKIFHHQELVLYNKFTFHSYKILLQNKAFLKFNFISFLMIGLGWAIVTSSSYLYTDPVAHGIFYSLYGVFYALGCLISERNILTKEKFLALFPYVAICIGGGIIFGFQDRGIYFISVFILLFGFLSGLAYGPILDESLKYMPENEITTASSVLVFTRLLASAIYIFISSLLYFSYINMFLIFIFISFSLMVLVHVLKTEK